MEDLEETPCLTFLHPDGEEWFDLNEAKRKYKIHYIRMELGGDDAIHKINKDEKNN